MTADPTARAVLIALIEHACPCNWGDEPESAAAWLKAELLTGAALPDSDDRHNLAARRMALLRGPLLATTTNREGPNDG